MRKANHACTRRHDSSHERERTARSLRFTDFQQLLRSEDIDQVKQFPLQTFPWNIVLFQERLKRDRHPAMLYQRPPHACTSLVKPKIAATLELEKNSLSGEISKENLFGHRHH
jgi:hypothetical protein